MTPEKALADALEEKMSDEILRMIESVDPTDTAKLDEIDARAWLWVKFPDMGVVYGGREGKGRFYYKDNLFLHRHRICKGMNHTRSRDALKAIRPGGWLINVEPRFFCGDADKAMFRAYSIKPIGATRMECFHNLVSALLPTEELAEPHAIIQAIEFERARSALQEKK